MMVQPATHRSGETTNRHARMFPSYRQQLGPAAYLVLGTLREFVFDNESKIVDFSWLVDQTGLTYSTVSRAMKEITEAGFITREREQDGRGYCYRITMLPPPEKRQPESQGASFFALESMQERSQNDPDSDPSEPGVQSSTTAEKTVFHSPIMLSENQKQQKQDVVASCGKTSEQADETPQSAILPPADLTPTQIELFLALHQHNAGLLAERIVRARPDLTTTDLKHDLAAAQARPEIERPIGLVCAAWLSGSRVHPPREREAQPIHPLTLEDTPLEPTDTEAYLIDQGFSARVAREFCDFDLEAVQEQAEAAFSTLDTGYERNQKIGKLVQRWRRVPPCVTAHNSVPQYEAYEIVSVMEEPPEEVPLAAEETDGVDVVALHARMTAYGYHSDETGIYLCPPATREDLDALWRQQHPELETVSLDEQLVCAEPPPEPVPASDEKLALWEQVLGRLQMMTARHTFDDHLRDTHLLTLAAGRAIIGCRTQQQKEAIEQQHLPAIRRALGDKLGYPVQVCCIIRRELGLTQLTVCAPFLLAESQQGWHWDRRESAESPDE